LIVLDNEKKRLTVLVLNNIEVMFDKVILILKGVSFEAPAGQIVTLLGANGAGKTTTLKAISGLLRPDRGEVTKGSIEFEGRRIDKLNSPDIVKLGIAQVLEGRRVFEHLNSEENLIAGAHTRSDSAAVRKDLEMVYDYFPNLRVRRKVRAGYLSGGEQQMMAIGRALMATPKLMLLDEPSLGLAPLLVEEIFEILTRMNADQKMTLLLVEQNVSMALNIAQYGYIMENGRVVLDGDAKTLYDNEDVREFYLGLTEIGKKSYRDVKHYKRRKRWLA
jgi:branched-chain amino acid transport system ATP-binding protein